MKLYFLQGHCKCFIWLLQGLQGRVCVRACVCVCLLVAVKGLGVEGLRLRVEGGLPKS